MKRLAGLAVFFFSVAAAVGVIAGKPDIGKGRSRPDLKKSVIQKLAKKIPILDLSKLSKDDLSKIKTVSVFPSVVGALPASQTNSIALGSICKEGHFVFLNKWETAGSSLLKIDVSDPANPSLALQTPPSQFPSGAGELFDGCEISPGLIHIAAWGGMKTFITDNLELLGRYDFTFMPSVGVTTVSDVAYLYAWPGIHRVNLVVNIAGYFSPPVEYNLLGTIPAWSGSTNDPPAAQGFSAARGERSDNFLLITGKPGVTLMDLSNEDSPLVSGSFSTPNIGRGIARYGDYVFVTGSGHSSEEENFNFKGYTIVKVFGSNQGPKVFIPFYELGSGNSIYDEANGIDVDGNFVYIAAGDSGLLVYHVDPLPSAGYPLPSFAGRCEMDCSARDVIVDGDYAYVACGNGGLRICQGIH